jgi:hypothetical protein
MSTHDREATITDDVTDLARRWLLNSRRGEDPKDRDIDLDDDVLELMVTDLDPERGWRVIIESLRLAETESDILSIAVALLEPLLREHGARFVGRTEDMAGSAPRFDVP